MQWLAEICVRRPVFALMLVMAMVVAGATAYLQLGVDRFPKMDLPSISVSTAYPGAAPAEVESEVTQLLEDAVATVAGIDELRSISREGTSILILTFDLNRDIDAGTQDVRDAINSVLNRLPPGTDPPVIRKQDTDSSPILTLAVSGERDPRELFVLADRFVKNVIESAPGVGQASIVGTSERAIQVNIEADKLASYQMSIIEVREALVRQNAEVPGGRVDVGFQELGLRTMGRFNKPSDFEELVVKTVGGMPVRLSDLGTVTDGQKEIRTLARLDGKPAIVVQIQRQSGTNTVEVIQGVKDRLTRSRELLPADVSLDIIQDQSRYIKAAMSEVQGHLIIGSILASIVVLLFMRSWRSTFIAAVAIPASIIATFALMRAFDFTLNNVTMLALVLMVGVVIDDAIVVLENVFHCIEEKGMDPYEAAIEGTREIGLAVLATTLSLVIVFLPVSFLSSVTGRMLYEFGVTATVAILISMVVSFTLTPMMCSRLLKPAKPNPDGHEPASRRGFYGWLDRKYASCLAWSMRHRLLVAGVSVIVIASNVPLYYFVKQDYVPTNVDESEFEIRVSAPEGATLSAMDVAMKAVEDELTQISGIEHVLTRAGSGSAVNSGDIFVRLQDSSTRTFSLGRLFRETLAGQPMAAFTGNFTQRSKMTEIRKRLAQFTDLRCSVRNLTSLRQGAPVDVDFTISGPGIETLAQFSEKLRRKVEQIPGLADVDTTLRLDKPELLGEIDRERAGALGVDVREIAETLRIAVGGDDRVSRFRDVRIDDAHDVELRLVGIDRSSPESISQLYVRVKPTSESASRGATLVSRTAGATPLTRLDNLVRFQPADAQSRIDRLARERMVAVRANVTGDYALADRIDAVRAAADELGVPPGFSVKVLGRGKELERTLNDFSWTFILSFIFMYIILAAQFEHLIHPFTILFSLPLAVPFGLVSLWLGGETLNLYSALGILVLFGVVKKASILQVDHTNALRAKGLSQYDAIMQANRDRLRPILMTTVAFVAGMLPLLLGSGPGAEERRSIAVLAVGGQTLSLLLTLLAIPVVYSLLDDMSQWLASRGYEVKKEQQELAVAANEAAVK